MSSVLEQSSNLTILKTHCFTILTMGCYFKPTLLSLVVVVGILNVGLCAQNVIRHGSSYNILSAADPNLYLTATQHTFRPRQGVYVGKVYTSEFHGRGNQFWDAITWPNSPDNQFWLYAKSATLNEITAAPLPDASIPPKNLVDIVYVVSNSTSDVYSMVNFRFLIRSTVLNKCVQYQGLDLQIRYEQCNASNIQQLWTAEAFIDDAATRNAVKPFFL